ncbi:MAG: rod shape-determining protein MreB [Peptococcaceae bacterium]|jgi:rod shape-determining protein MreB|nr:rod shape-determining protein MreB [Peptococcaceae bacterium]MBQ2120598.1 rod shape-determining protein MreB [Peptococcaceae bacterium]MBQ2448401.1 rod shape-determining protein MreB [Peptococcaceae bacterium]MBQ5682238.1 rod shape-determining protein MreB [Peptococcaceae bacterium]MBQ5703089.1 rod shape-determining protein MreB [Peptococcaceae bacterium]
MCFFLKGEDIAVDLGTASVLVYVNKEGIVLNEPSVVAIDNNTNRVIAVGTEAREMLGRTPGNIVAIRPLRDGVIAEYDVTEKMLKYFISKASKKKSFVKPRVMVCIPSGVTSVEERAVKQAALAAGAKEAYLIEEPVAAALGAGIDIAEPNGSMVVDIGGGTTDIAVMSLGGVVCSKSIRVGGDKFDDAIVRYIRRYHNLVIGERSAEEVKKDIGSAYPSLRAGETAELKGRDLISGLPKTVTITAEEVNEAIAEQIEDIIAAVKEVLEKTPPELASDIMNRGIVMTGGGSLLHGMDILVSERTGLPTYIPDDAISCVAIGTGLALQNIDVLRGSEKKEIL